MEQSPQDPDLNETANCPQDAYYVLDLLPPSAHVSPAELVVVGDGEYLRAETSGEFLSLTWSSRDAAAAAIRKALDVLGDPVAGDEPVFVQLDSENGDGKSGGGTASDVLEYLEGAKPPLAFVRVTFPECEFVWGAPFPRLQTSEAAYAEIGLRVHVGEARRTIDALITQTATDQLNARHIDVEGQIKQLAVQGPLHSS